METDAIIKIIYKMRKYHVKMAKKRKKAADKKAAAAAKKKGKYGYRAPAKAAPPKSPAP